MNDLNEVLLEGRLVRDPNARKLESGALVCTFSIASNSHYVDREKAVVKEKTIYILVETWQGVAHVCTKYLKKGDGVRILGKIKQSKWEGEHGIKMERTFILAEHVDFKPKTTAAHAVQEEIPASVKATDEEPSEKEQEEINEKIIKEEPEE